MSNRFSKGGMRDPILEFVSTKDGRFRVFGLMMAAEAFKVEFHNYYFVVWLVRYSSGPKGRMFEVG